MFAAKRANDNRQSPGTATSGPWYDSRMAHKTAELDLLLAFVDQGFDHASWHGPNLCSAIRGVTAKQAAIRPAPGRRNIWEQVIHAAYWKYVVRRRLLKEKRGSFPLKGSNWFERPVKGASNDRDWQADIALLIETHRTLREAVASMSASRLHSPLSAKDKRITPARLITGIAMHDVYHAGQIGLIKRIVVGE